MLKDLFSYNNREAAGVILFVLIALIIKLVPRYFFQGKSFEYSLIERQRIDSFRSEKNAVPKSGNYDQINWFHFDPNTLSPDSLMILGLKKYLTERIAGARAKGFKFYNSDDLLHIYGMDSIWYEKAVPWINIRSRKRSYGYDAFARRSDDRSRKLRSGSKEKINVSIADSVDLIRLHGIGPVLASRIIKYRRILGGFHAIGQLKEVYGIHDSLFMKIAPNISVDSKAIVPIDLTADFKTLRRHPYVDVKTAKVILAYRKTHPEVVLSTLNIRNILALDTAFVRRIWPYLE